MDSSSICQHVDCRTAIISANVGRTMCSVCKSTRWNYAHCWHPLSVSEMIPWNEPVLTIKCFWKCVRVFVPKWSMSLAELKFTSGIWCAVFSNSSDAWSVAVVALASAWSMISVECSLSPIPTSPAPALSLCLPATPSSTALLALRHVLEILDP